MARTTNITFAQVAQIADTMKAAGHRPTARAVRERIGSGSMGTIHNLLQQWQGKTSEQPVAAVLPDSVATALMEFVQTQIAEACEPLANELEAATEAADALAESNERLCIEIDELKSANAEAREVNAAAWAKHAMSEKVISEMKETARQYQVIIDDMKTELDRLRERDKAATAIRERVGILDDKNEYLTGELAAARTEIAGLSAKLDAAQERLTDKCAQLEKSEKMLDGAIAEAKHASRCNEAANARLEAAAREIDSLRMKSAKSPATKATRAKPAIKDNDTKTR